MTKHLVLGVLFFSQLLWAGHEVGGGNAVVCTDKPTRFLDYYEAGVILPELELDLGKQGNELDRVRYVLERWARLDRPRAEKFMSDAEKFFQSALFLEKLDLPDTHDYGYVPIDTIHCRIEQLAAQRELPVTGARPFLVKKELWDALSLDDRAGLILHELLYWEARKLGHKNSINTRLLNSILSSRRMESLASSEYFGELAKLGFSQTPGLVPPAWVMSPVVLPGAKAGVAFTADISHFAHDPQGSPLRFGTDSGPSWLSLSPDGKVMGTPTAADVGVTKFYVNVCNASGLCMGNYLHVTVAGDVYPLWMQDPIDLGLQPITQYWIFDLTKMISPADHVTFQLLQAPAWIKLDQTGKLHGRPLDEHVGKYVVKVRAINESGNFSDASAFGEVLSTGISIHPHWQSSELAIPDGVEDISYRENLVPYVQNPEGQSLKFEMVSGPSWIKITGEGVLMGIPKRPDVGTNTVSVRVSAGSGDILHQDTARLTITVRHTNHPPYWTKNPIPLPGAYVNQAYRQSVAPYAADIDGNVLRYTLRIGPPWLKVNPMTGELTGTPGPGDVGLATAQVEVSDGYLLSSAVEVRVEVAY